MLLRTSACEQFCKTKNKKESLFPPSLSLSRNTQSTINAAISKHKHKQHTSRMHRAELQRVLRSATSAQNVEAKKLRGGKGERRGQEGDVASRRFTAFFKTAQSTSRSELWRRLSSAQVSTKDMICRNTTRDNERQRRLNVLNSRQSPGVIRSGLSPDYDPQK